MSKKITKEVITTVGNPLEGILASPSVVINEKGLVIKGATSKANLLTSPVDELRNVDVVRE